MTVCVQLKKKELAVGLVEGPCEAGLPEKDSVKSDWTIVMNGIE